jgi:hypothetical protein
MSSVGGLVDVNLVSFDHGGSAEHHQLRRVERSGVPQWFCGIAAHTTHVEAFSQETGRAVKQTTMTAAAHADLQKDRQHLLSNRKGIADTKFQLMYFGIPSLLVFVLVAISIGVISLDAVAMTAAVVAVLGGIVVLGSNRSTSQEATAQLDAAETRRAALIGQIDLHVISQSQKS